MPSRRRFLTVAAAALSAPRAALAAPAPEWRGRALGASARVVLVGAEPAEARRIFASVERVLATVEAQFSLHRDSALVRLNRDGRLARPGADILDLFHVAGAVNGATGGMFDPTIQPYWRAVASGGDTGRARALVGWDGVRIAEDEIRLARPGMALTMNGIAQGWATDRIAALLRAHGFGDVLVDIGEVVALGRRPAGGPWRAAVALPDGTQVSRLDLTDRALATSAPMGTRIGPDGTRPHILAPDGREALWRLASVSATRAALADALSTAFCLMDRRAIASALAAFPEARLEALL